MLDFKNITSVLTIVEYGMSVARKGIGPWWALFLALAFVTAIVGYFTYRIIIERMTCTEPVEASCVEYAELNSNDGTTYAPVWEYQFNGQIIRSAEKIYSTSPKTKSGDIRILYVNPDNPEKFRQSVMGYIFFVGISAIIAIVLIWAMIVKAGNGR